MICPSHGSNDLIIMLSPESSQLHSLKVKSNTLTAGQVISYDELIETDNYCHLHVISLRAVSLISKLDPPIKFGALKS